MAGTIRFYFRNYDSSDSTSARNGNTATVIVSVETVGFTAPSGCQFKEWNSARDGSGTAFQAGDHSEVAQLYAIWESASTSAVTITYKNATIATMDATGVKTLLTGNAFCEDDIAISYTAPDIPSATGVSF